MTYIARDYRDGETFDILKTEIETEAIAAARTAYENPQHGKVCVDCYEMTAAEYDEKVECEAFGFDPDDTITIWWYAVSIADDPEDGNGSWSKEDAIGMAHDLADRNGYAYAVKTIDPYDDFCKDSEIIAPAEAEDLAAKIRNSNTWDMDAVEDLCRMALMLNEFRDADGETFESVAYSAAEILGVEL